MAQHLLIADLAAPFLLAGLRIAGVRVLPAARPRSSRSPAGTRLRRAFRTLRRPLVAIPIWIAILYGWHFAFSFEGALDNPAAPRAPARVVLVAALLVWWSVIEPKRRRMPGELWKVPYVLGARLSGMFLGMALILMRSPAYDAFYGDRARDHGLSPLTDQQVAGGMMLGVDLVVMLSCLSLVFWRSAEDHDQREPLMSVTRT